MKSILNNIKLIFQILNKKQINFFYLILLLTFISIGLDLIGIGLFIPIINVLLEQDLYLQKSFLNKYVNFLTEYSDSNIYILLFTPLILIFFIKTTFQIFFTWIQNVFVNQILYIQSTSLYKLYIKQDYIFHSERETSSAVRNILSEVNNLQYYVLHIINLIIECLLILIIFVFLVVFEPIITISCFLFYSIFTLSYYLVTQSSFTKWGNAKIFHSNLFIKTILNGFSGIKEIKIFGVENRFTKIFEQNIKKYSYYVMLSSLFSSIPKIIIEFLTVLLMSIVLLFFIQKGQDTNMAMAKLAIFAVIIFRLMPSFNRLNFSLHNLKSLSPSIKIVSDEFFKLKKNLLDQNLLDQNLLDQNLLDQNIKKIDFKYHNSINFKNLNFKYKNSDKYIFKNLNLSLKKNLMIGILGPSGSGKTTFVNLITGLIKPNNGQILIDNFQNINDDISSWQSKIGYVSQSIFLFDGTLEENISFGSDGERIDHSKLLNSIKLSQLDKFVKEQKDGLKTIIGENGAKISGGQIQRIGIARSLYRDNQVLILDESTNALDEKTEKEFFKSLMSLKGSKTIIVISHNKENLKNCDKVYNFKDGKILID
jgi:ABC-type bacteriocin/lantibiotic exporter with double-glycine peptidase domain